MGSNRLLKICSSLYIQGVSYIWGYLINPFVNYCVTVVTEFDTRVKQEHN
jgi:hypothetical protein